MMPQVRVDAGAIKHILSGADVMCPGLTNPNASLPDLPEGTMVAIMAEGKEHAMAIGQMKMSSAQM